MSLGSVILGGLKTLGSSLFSGVSGLVGGLPQTLLGDYMAKQDFKRQIQASKELAKYQMDLQQQAIDTQNEYNLPKNQMARLQDAGLNPHLVYGSGGVVGNSSSAASPSIPGSPKLQRSEILRHSIDAALSTQMTLANVENVRAQNDNIREQNKLIAAQVETEKQRKRDLEQSANRREFDLQLERDLRDVNVQAREYARDIAYYQRDFALHHASIEESNDVIRSNERLISDYLAEHAEERALLQLTMERLGVKSTLANIQNTLAAAANYAADGNLKRFTYKMMKLGYNPNDSKAWRMFDNFMEGLFGGENAIKNFGEGLRDFFKE